MTRKPDHQRFADLGYEDFRRMATDPALSPAQRIGFPDEYRAGFEPAILDDIAAKLPALRRRGARLLDIGCGCGDLARLIVAEAAAQDAELWLCDAPEVLAQLPGGPRQVRLAGRFPGDCHHALAAADGGFDAILCYSVFHYVYADGNPYAFLDALLPLLAPGAACLVGDIPNASMRRRFLASAAGRAYHRQYSGRDEDPMVEFNRLEAGSIDDAVVTGLMLRCRQAGFHAYLVPQPAALPLANRREDLLIVHP